MYAWNESFVWNGKTISTWIYTECNCMHWIHLFGIGTGWGGGGVCALVSTVVNLRVSQNPGNFLTSLALRDFQEGLACLELASRKFPTDRIRSARTTSTDCSDTTVMQISKNRRRYSSRSRYYCSRFSRPPSSEWNTGLITDADNISVLVTQILGLETARIAAMMSKECSSM